jgi:NCS1 family nucleobase:cation symporter-1
MVIFGQAIWNPLDLLQSFLDEGTHQNRAGVFFVAFAFSLAQLGTNIAANSVSAGTDMTALVPRYLNIRRGGYICALVGLCMCPWHLLSTANNFTTYLSAYSVFLSSIAGVIVCDYYLVRKGYLQIKDLYSARKGSPYFYHGGFSWRAYAAYISGILINIVGFVGVIRPGIPMGANYIYRLNFFCGFLVAAGVYWLLCYLFPVPAMSDVWMEVGDEVPGSMAYGTDMLGSDYDEERAAGAIDFKGARITESGGKRDLEL